MSYYLFLDDDRIPYLAANHVHPVELRFLYRKEEWVVVRDFRQFIDQILYHGLPKCISFDYDLGPEGTPSGYDCAVWLIDYCNQHNLKLPQTLCHSLNPDGKELIQTLFKYVNNNPQ